MKKGKPISKEKEEKLQQKKDQEDFNSITNKKKVENQNQTHNVVREGIGTIFQGGKLGLVVGLYFLWFLEPKKVLISNNIGSRNQKYY